MQVFLQLLNTSYHATAFIDKVSIANTYIEKIMRLLLLSYITEI